jgi:hypothetical protein
MSEEKCPKCGAARYFHQPPMHVLTHVTDGKDCLHRQLKQSRHELTQAHITINGLMQRQIELLNEQLETLRELRIWHRALLCVVECEDIYDLFDYAVVNQTIWRDRPVTAYDMANLAYALAEAEAAA